MLVERFAIDGHGLNLQANSAALRARWGFDPCPSVTVERSSGDENPTSAYARKTAGELRRDGAPKPYGEGGQTALDEARAWLARALKDGPITPSVCVIGAGAGWIVDAVEELSAEARVLILEPEPSSTRVMLGRRDYRRLIEAGQLMVITGPAFDGAAAAWRLYARCVSEPTQLIHPAAATAHKEATVAALRVARKAIADARANENARRRLAAPYLLNTLRNLPVLTREADASALFDLCPRRPVVIAAAGPSLNLNLEELRPFRDRVVLVAADTALRTCIGAGLAPDFVVGVDPAAANARHFSGVGDCGTTALVAEMSLQRSTFDRFMGRTFLYRVASHQPWPWLQSLGVDVTMLRAWGSVVVTAFDLAVRLGGDPLIFIGADLAYTDGQPYCRGTVYEDDWAQWMAEGKSLVEIWKGAIAMHPTLVETHSGEECVTAPHLIQFRDALLNASRALPQQVFNATGRGILRGAPIGQQTLAATLQDAAPFSIPAVPRPSQSTATVARLLDVVSRGVPANGPYEWQTVLAEHEPSGEALSEQLATTLAELATWARSEIPAAQVS